MQTNPGSLLERLTGEKRGKSYGLGTLRLGQSLQESEVLTVLNYKPSTIEKPRTLINLQAPKLVTVLADSSDKLRGWVDEWIDSGRTSDGTDWPEKRFLKQRGATESAIHAYSQKRGNVSIFADHQGKLLLWLHPPPGNSGYGPSPSQPSSDDISRSYLIFTLLSPLATTLAKCRADGCGKYFALKQTRRSYAGGTLCDKHRRARSQESAKTATAKDRKEAKVLLHSLVARRFCKRIDVGSSRCTDSKLKSAIVTYLNAQIEKNDLLQSVYLRGGRKGITAKWVATAKNWSQIRKALKRRGEGRQQPAKARMDTVSQLTSVRRL